MKLGTAKKNNYLFKEGDNGDCFFMVKYGMVDVEIDNKYVRTLGQGECFG
jgi:CRP-like cAMP-binding protein